MAVTHDKDDYNPEPRFGRDPRPERRDSVSATLRHAREDYGQDVRSIAQVLRIRQAYLEALESGDFERLPGTAYAIGFLRTYAEFLGLDGDAIVDRFKAEVEGAERRTELIFPEPVTEGRIPGGAIILISVVLLALAYAGWFYLSNQGRTVADLIPALPAQLQALLDSSGEGVADRDRAPATQTAAIPAPEQPPVAPLATEPTPTPTPAPEAAVPEAPTPETARPDTTYAATSQPAARPTAESTQRPGPVGTGATAMTPPPEVPPNAAAAVPTVPAPEPEPEPVPAVPAPAEPIRAPAEPAVDAADRVDTAAGAVDVPAPVAVDDPAPVAEDAPGPVAMDAPVPSGPADPPGGPGDVEPAPLVEQTVVIPAPPSAPQAFAMPSEPAPRVYGETNDNGRIVLRAVQDSWVQVRDNRDALLMTRVLRTGDVYYVPDQDGLTLLTGNAGGIQIEVDGVTLPPIGPLGAVRRQIALDPTRLLEGTAGAR